mmetsp:Transcript_93053/g.161282  ORF Transcript_93053/g.161282 Transcript_93053/m.161282 type:complete len:81 (-) Transcript_93053:1846-2088(-)
MCCGVFCGWDKTLYKAHLAGWGANSQMVDWMWPSVPRCSPDAWNSETLHIVDLGTAHSHYVWGWIVPHGKSSQQSMGTGN